MSNPGNPENESFPFGLPEQGIVPSKPELVARQLGEWVATQNLQTDNVVWDPWVDPEDGRDALTLWTLHPETGAATPRAEIRMQDDEIFAIWGTPDPENVDPLSIIMGEPIESPMDDDVLALLAGKLLEMPDHPTRDEHLQTIADLRLAKALDAKLMLDPDTQLTRAELVVVYELERDCEELGMYELLTKIREQRGNRDHAALAKLLGETIGNEAKRSFETLNRMAESFGTEPVSQEAFDEALAATQQRWAENGVYEYLLNQVSVRGLKYNLRNSHFIVTATPNVSADAQQLYKFLQHDEDMHLQLEQPGILHKDYYRSRVPSPALSGYPLGDGPVKFSIIPTKLDEHFYGTPDELALEEIHRQGQHPELNLHGPTMLEMSAYWSILKQRYPKRFQTGRWESIEAGAFHYDLATFFGGVAPSSSIDNSAVTLAPSKTQWNQARLVIS